MTLRAISCLHTLTALLLRLMDGRIRGPEKVHHSHGGSSFFGNITHWQSSAISWSLPWPRDTRAHASPWVSMARGARTRRRAVGTAGTAPGEQVSNILPVVHEPIIILPCERHAVTVALRCARSTKRAARLLQAPRRYSEWL